MYNEGRKTEFLNEYSSSIHTRKYSQAIFNVMQSYEEDAGADLCSMGVELLQPAVNESFGLRTRSIDTAVLFLQEYVRWCMKKGYQTSDGIFQVQIDTKEKIRKLMVSSPLHLQKILDVAFDKEEEDTVDCLYRALFWLAYAGMEDYDAIKVRTNDVDLQNLLVKYDGKVYELYKESIPALTRACSLSDFSYHHPNYSKKVRRARADGDKLLRGMKSGEMNLLTTRSIINKKFKEKNIKTSYSRIYLSGIFYRIYERERAGDSPNFDEIVADKINRTDYTISQNHSRTKIANSIQRDFVADYEKWKVAFS